MIRRQTQAEYDKAHDDKIADHYNELSRQIDGNIFNPRMLTMVEKSVMDITSKYMKTGAFAGLGDIKYNAKEASSQEIAALLFRIESLEQQVSLLQAQAVNLSDEDDEGEDDDDSWDGDSDDEEYDDEYDDDDDDGGEADDQIQASSLSTWNTLYTTGLIDNIDPLQGQRSRIHNKIVDYLAHNGQNMQDFVKIPQLEPKEWNSKCYQCGSPAYEGAFIKQCSNIYCK